MSSLNKPLPRFRYGDQSSIAFNDMVSARKETNWAPHNNPTNDSYALQLSRNALHGMISSTGLKKFAEYGCHNHLRSWKSAKAIWSCFGYRTSKQVATTYLEWLCYRSPWEKAGIVPDQPFDQMFDVGFVWSGLDKTPANLLHDFLIATRAITEFPESINLWYKLVTIHGIDESLAFVYLSVFYNSLPRGQGFYWLEKNSENQILFLDRSDWALNTYTATEEYVRSFLAGKPDRLSEMFYPTANTLPINTLWGEKDSKNSYQRVVEGLYSNNRYTTRSLLIQEDRGFLSRTLSKEPRIFRPEQCLEILKLEQQRLLG